MSTQKSVTVVEKDVSKEVLDKVNKLREYGEIQLPDNYSAENALKAAWMYLQDLQDKNKKPALEVCSRNSVAKALFKMVSSGLSVIKNQCYLVVYGTELTYQVSYFGSIAIAKRTTEIIDVNGNVVYEGDAKGFKYEVDVETGATKIIAHPQDIKNIDINKIVGAYATAIFKDGRIKTKIMSMKQIRENWLFGYAKGNSMAHKRTPDQMAIRSVINRLLKMEINSSDDSYLNMERNDARDINSESGKEEAIETIEIPVTTEKEEIKDTTKQDKVVDPVQEKEVNTKEPAF